MSLSQYLAKLDTPEPGRQFIVASIFQLLLGSKESARYSQKQKLQAIERCLDLDTDASLSLTVRLLVKHAVSKAEGSVPHVVHTWEAWELLLAALATSKDKSIISHGILELYFSSDLGGRDGIDTKGGDGEHGKMEGHPLVKAWAVVPESVNCFVPEIERRLVRAASMKYDSKNNDAFEKCWLRVLPFYRYLMMREFVAECDRATLVTLWNGLIRLCCVYKCAKKAVLPFLVDVLDMKCTLSGQNENLFGEYALDVADVILSHQHASGKAIDSNIGQFVKGVFQQLSREGAFAKSKEKPGMMIRRILDPLRALLPSYVEAMMPWCHVVGLCVLQFSSHSVNGVACLEFLLAVLRAMPVVHDNNGCKIEENDWHCMLRFLDTVCIISMFYAQDHDVRLLLESLRVVVGECWDAQPCGNFDAAKIFPFNTRNVDEILSWIDRILFVMEHKKIEFIEDLEVGLLLSLLSHQSENVRLRVLQSFKILPRCPLFCYYAVPVVLFRIGQSTKAHSGMAFAFKLVSVEASCIVVQSFLETCVIQ